ncbi:uncharacterized protein LOC126910215, partial [Daktulosphaira vitifoliae]|uniref:uncharacterized protein LOC126910215 n=1 Tax=Daktulosphaira vitifoliae TaxID=58002 RepID=UPI0021AA822E
LSLISTCTLFTAIYSPQWLVGPTEYECLLPNLIKQINQTESFDVRCRPSLGIFSRCKKINGIQHCGSFAVEGLATDSNMFPTPWKIAIVLMFSGIFISFIMSIMAVCSFCKQSIRRKSMFGLAGSGQGLSGKIIQLKLIIKYV